MQHQQYLRRRAATFFLTATLSLLPAWAGSQNDNLPNFQKVNDQVYRGAQPTNSGFQQLAQLGIKTVVDLRDIGEHSQADEQKIVTGLGMRYVSIPMHGMSTPKDDLVAAVQALFNDPANGPVFVHCKRGADRTGMVVAVYRISHDGWDNKKALSEAKSNGMSMFERAIQHYVMDYKPAVTLATAGAGADSASTIADTRAVR
jgi:uncharacterized protein (TIGR01244 family)